MTSFFNKKYEYLASLKERRKIQKELLLDAAHWYIHATLTWPHTRQGSMKMNPYEPDIPALRKDLNNWFRWIELQHIRVAAAAIIVFRRWKAPHAHALVTSYPTPTTKMVADISHNQLAAWWHHQCKFRTDRRLTQQTMRDYFTDPENMNLDSRRPDTFELLYYHRGLIEKYRPREITASVASA